MVSFHKNQIKSNQISYKQIIIKSNQIKFVWINKNMNQIKSNHILFYKNQIESSQISYKKPKSHQIKFLWIIKNTNQIIKIKLNQIKSVKKMLIQSIKISLNFYEYKSNHIKSRLLFIMIKSNMLHKNLNQTKSNFIELLKIQNKTNQITVPFPKTKLNAMIRTALISLFAS